MNLDATDLVAAHNCFKDVIDMSVYTLPCNHVFVRRSKLSMLLIKYDSDDLGTCDTVNAVKMRPVKKFRSKENSAVVLRTYMSLIFVLKQKFGSMDLDANSRKFVESMHSTYKTMQRKLFDEYVPDDPDVEFDKDGFLIRYINTMEMYLLRALQLSKLLKLREDGDAEGLKTFQSHVTGEDLDTDKYFTREIVTDLTDNMKEELLKTNMHRDDVIASIDKLRDETDSTPDSDKLDELVSSVDRVTISNE